MERIEGFIVVVSEGTKGECDQEREEDERLTRRLVPFENAGGN